MPSVLARFRLPRSDFRNRICVGTSCPFGSRSVVNPADGTFLGTLLTNNSDLTVPDPAAERGALLTTRILLDLRRRLPAVPRSGSSRDGRPRVCRSDSLIFTIRKHGGLSTGRSPPTAPSKRDRKQIYGQAFAIYALAEYHLAANGRRGTARPSDRHVFQPHRETMAANPGTAAVTWRRFWRATGHRSKTCGSAPWIKMTPSHRTPTFTCWKRTPTFFACGPTKAGLQQSLDASCWKSCLPAS